MTSPVGLGPRIWKDLDLSHFSVALHSIASSTALQIAFPIRVPEWQPFHPMRLKRRCIDVDPQHLKHVPLEHLGLRGNVLSLYWSYAQSRDVEIGTIRL